MPYFAVFYDVVHDFVARRGAYREEHLRRVSESHARGELILGGALAEPTDRALLVFHAADKRVAEAFIESDPYVVNRLVKNWEVRPWNVVTGNEASPNLIVPGQAEILRTWSARASNEQWPRYREHFTERVLPELRGIAGYLGATLSVRVSGEQREILVETYWRSLDAVQAFAGVDVEAAVVASEATALLAEHHKRVHHYEIVLSDRAKF